MNVAVEKLNLPILKDKELEFISEYFSVMKPISVALNQLQAEKECYYGCPLPTLFVTQDTLASLDAAVPNNLCLKHCMSLLTSVISWFNSRFGNFFVIEPEHGGNCRLLASVCHLYFKFRWISLLQESNFGNHEATASQVKNKLKEAVRNCNFDTINNNADPDLSSEDDFFKNMDSSFSSDSKNNLELLNYLKDTSKSINSLDKYPIQKIFKKYNTTLPFSAPVERLFSFASLVHSPNELVF